MKPATKRRIVTRFQKYALNPFSKRVAGFVGPALLETTGRRTGKTRRTPVGAVQRGGAFWIVAEQGRHASYVRNIEANHRVRIRYRGRWHDGNAHVLPHEDPRKHTHGLNGLFVRLVGTELLTIRIDPKKH
ncbi:MAG TPA: nitroreductase/quinone reductase family protein [Actinomycetota bacterium]|jgi:deazaflavin-dependent oxidoreductase (nitroreductase family)|nr:nitroreductase/quinone reductase family protein [Actinomycetota bacterium]